VVDRIAERRGIRLRKPFLRSFETGTDGTMVLAKPLTYMNNSGSVVPSLLSRSDATLDDLVVICDNMDLPVGEIRLKRKGASLSHNGIASIVEAVGSGLFVRLYVGVGRPVDTNDAVDHVLGVPSAEERQLIDDAMDRAAETAQQLVDEEVERVMNRINARR